MPLYRQRDHPDEDAQGGHDAAAVDFGYRVDRCLGLAGQYKQGTAHYSVEAFCHPLSLLLTTRPQALTHEAAGTEQG
jgi:hypothetical protein